PFGRAALFLATPVVLLLGDRLAAQIQARTGGALGEPIVALDLFAGRRLLGRLTLVVTTAGTHGEGMAPERQNTSTRGHRAGHAGGSSTRASCRARDTGPTRTSVRERTLRSVRAMARHGPPRRPAPRRTWPTY